MTSTLALLAVLWLIQPELELAPIGRPETYPAGIGNDLAFEVAVEDSVRLAARPNRLEAMMPAADARLIRMLGCRQLDCRETATELLAARGWDARRSLWWGTRHRDPEVRSRCEALLARLACGACGGWGLCPACLGTSNAAERDGDFVWCQGGRIVRIDVPGSIIPTYACACRACEGSGKPGGEAAQE